MRSAYRARRRHVSATRYRAASAEIFIWAYSARTGLLLASVLAVSVRVTVSTHAPSIRKCPPTYRYYSFPYYLKSPLCQMHFT